jgi:hypothetical protein
MVDGRARKEAAPALRRPREAVGPLPVSVGQIIGVDIS